MARRLYKKLTYANVCSSYPNRVATAGHLEVNACNFSGGAMTAITDFPVRIITLR